MKGKGKPWARGTFQRPGLLRRVLYLGPHTCPWWFAYTFDNPFRHFFHHPGKILGDYVVPGQTVLDVGCGLGYFSLALARLVGPEGRVIAVDVQSGMVRRARQRAARQGLDDRINFRVCESSRLGVDGPVDFVLAFWVVHEFSDPNGLFEQVMSILHQNARFLVVEPRGHVSAARFGAMIEMARAAGFKVSKGPGVRFSRSFICSIH